MRFAPSSEFVTIEFDLEPELVAFVQAFAAERDMSPESFAGMVVGQYQGPSSQQTVNFDEFNVDDSATYAYLNKDGVPVLCSWSEWRQWWNREWDRCQIKYEEIDDWSIETRFQGCIIAPDGPPLFWEVGCSMPGSIAKSYRFGTKEAALDFHAEFVEKIISGELR